MADPFRASQELDRRKRLAATAAGAVAGAAAAAGIGLLLATMGDIALVGSGMLLGAIFGGALGELIATRVDMGPWEPLAAGRSYVGTHVPDDSGGV
jgi:hypothetical protein